MCNDDDNDYNNKFISIYTAVVAQRAQAGLVTPITATPGLYGGNDDAGSSRAAIHSSHPQTLLARDVT